MVINTNIGATSTNVDTHVSSTDSDTNYNPPTEQAPARQFVRKLNLDNKNIWQLRKLYKRYESLRQHINQQVSRRLLRGTLHWKKKEFLKNRTNATPAAVIEGAS